MNRGKIFLFSLVFLFIVATAFSQSITVTSPNGGENWQKGTTHNITWSSSGVSGNVIIKLLKGGTMLGSVAWNIPNTGTYSWTINDIGGTPIATGSDYRVLVRSFDDHSIEDQSNSNFTISPISSGGSITVTNPNGGEEWYIGSAHNITWSSSGVSGNVIIKLLKGGTMLGSIAYNIPNSGSYSWTINDVGGTPIAQGSDYKVLVRSFDDHSIEDRSNANFTISSAPTGCTINVTNPSSSSNLHANQNINITWDPSFSPGGNVKITMVYANCPGTSGPIPLILFTITNSTGNDGSYSWTTPDIKTTKCYKINIHKIGTDCHGSSEVFKVKSKAIIGPWIRIEQLREIKIWPEPGPDPWWRMSLKELIEEIKERGPVPRPDPVPVDIFLYKGRELVKKLGSMSEKGQLNWIIVVNSRGIGKFKVEKSKSEKFLKGGKEVKGDYKLILKNAKTGQIIKEIPAEMENKTQIMH